MRPLLSLALVVSLAPLGALAAHDARPAARTGAPVHSDAGAPTLLAAKPLPSPLLSSTQGRKIR